MKLLADGQLFAADADLNKINGEPYPIIKIIRDDGERKEYTLNNDYVIVTASGNEIAKKPVSEFRAKASELLAKIQSSTQSTFESAETESFMKSIGCTSMKSGSTDKRDITILLHEYWSFITNVVFSDSTFFQRT